MIKSIQGLHHITAVAGDPQKNVDFYQQVLGQRLVKTTVNFDDPATYHLYYGDEIGSPGTILTFFPWSGMRPGVPGNGEAAAVGYTVPANSLDFWDAHLRRHGIVVGERQRRFGAELIPFRDPDGMALELVGMEEPPLYAHWTGGPIAEDAAIRGFNSVTLWVSEVETTRRILEDSMGYSFVGQEGQRFRLSAGGSERGILVDLLHRPDQPRGRFGAGSVHHVAFRVSDDAEQLAYREALQTAGLQVTAVQDRQYFHSIYYRVPAGILFELATDPPGFLLDESVEKLGSTLRLPPWLATQYDEIAARLPVLDRQLLPDDKALGSESR